MKKFFDFNKEKLKSRNSIIFVCVIALVCCIGVVNGKLSDKGTLGVSAGYEEYEQKRWMRTAERYWWIVSIFRLRKEHQSRTARRKRNPLRPPLQKVQLTEQAAATGRAVLWKP